MEANTKKKESKMSQPWWLDGHLGPENSKWLSENRKEMEQSFKQVLKLIEDDSLMKGDEMLSQNGSELMARVQECYRGYQSLAERYDHLTGKLHKSVPLEGQVMSLGNSESVFDEGSLLMVTPDQKQGLRKSDDQVPFLGSGGSSDLSLKEGAESSSSLSDSESESFDSSVNIYSGSPVKNDNGAHQKIIELDAELPSMREKLQLVEEDNGDSMLKFAVERNHKELVERLVKYEERLRLSNIKLQLSDEEVARLKTELEKSNSQLQSAQRGLKMREADLELEKRQVLDLKKQIAEAEDHVSDADSKILRLVKELDGAREMLKASDEEIAKLKHEFRNKISDDTRPVQDQLKLAQEDIAILKAQLESERSQIVDMQQKTATYISDLSVRNNELVQLESALCDAKEKFSREKAQLQSEIVSMTEKHAQLDAKLTEWQLTARTLEENMWESRTKHSETLLQHESKEVEWQDQMNQLMIELVERGDRVEALNKDLDRFKLAYDMLVADKDELTAKVNTLRAAVSCRDDQILQMEEQSRRLRGGHLQLVSESESSRKLADELKVRVKELEKEVDRQRIVILDEAENKREAIRQLCFSLDHYRSGYKELREALLKRVRPAIVA